MSERYAIQVQWDRRLMRYIAKVKKLPALTAFGATLDEARANMETTLAQHLSSERP